MKLLLTTILIFISVVKTASEFQTIDSSGLLELLGTDDSNMVDGKTILNQHRVYQVNSVILSGT